MFRHVFFALISFSVLASTAQQAPREFSLIARSGLYHGHRMPEKTFALNASPAVGPQGQISFNVITVEGRPNSGVWYGDTEGGKIVEVAPEGYMAADPKINSLGDAVFAVFDEVKTLGIFAYLANERRVAQVYKPGEAFGLESVGSPHLNSRGDLSFIGRTVDGQRVLVGKKQDNYFKYAEEGASGISYIFSPDFNERGRAAAKVRLGKTDERSENQPDEIRIWNADGETVVAAKDRDADPSSVFAGFGNTVSLNDRGDVAFRADLAEGGAGLFIFEAEGGKPKQIASSADFSEIEYFAVKLNNRGQAVFRAKDRSGLRGIYFFNGEHVEKVVQEGDALPSDLGPVKIYFDRDHPGFGGSPGLNDRGEIVFLASTVNPSNHDETYSKAVYIVR